MLELEPEDYKFLLENEKRIGDAQDAIRTLRKHILDKFGEGLKAKLSGKYTVNEDKSISSPFQNNIAIEYAALRNKKYKYKYENINRKYRDKYTDFNEKYIYININIHISLLLEQDEGINDKVCITFRKRRHDIKDEELNLPKYGLEEHNHRWYIGKDKFRKKIDCERYDYTGFIDKAVQSAVELVDRFSRSLEQSKS